MVIQQETLPGSSFNQPPDSATSNQPDLNSSGQISSCSPDRSQTTNYQENSLGSSLRTSSRSDIHHPDRPLSDQDSPWRITHHPTPLDLQRPPITVNQPQTSTQDILNRLRHLQRSC